MGPVSSVSPSLGVNLRTTRSGLGSHRVCRWAHTPVVCTPRPSESTEEGGNRPTTGVESPARQACPSRVKQHSNWGVLHCRGRRNSERSASSVKVQAQLLLAQLGPALGSEEDNCSVTAPTSLLPPFIGHHTATGIEGSGQHCPPATKSCFSLSPSALSPPTFPFFPPLPSPFLGAPFLVPSKFSSLSE